MQLRLTTALEADSTRSNRKWHMHWKGGNKVIVGVRQRKKYPKGVYLVAIPIKFYFIIIQEVTPKTRIYL